VNAPTRTAPAAVPAGGSVDGAVVIVTGGARGVGAILALRLLQAGARVVIADVTDQVDDVALRDSADVLVHRTDVADRDSTRDLAAATVAQFGRIDALVNNAAIYQGLGGKKSFTEIEVDEWDRVMAVNAKGVFLGTKYAIPALRRAGGGSIVNISSVAGIGQSLHQEPAYAASKGAIRIFTKVTASQHAKDKIRCNSVHPGPVDTEMFHSAFRDREAMERRLQRVPLQRMGTVPEIVSAVLYLASDDSSYMTGSEMVIDGGALAQ